MKKVGIMTLHIGDNYGALLQCYALRQCVKKLGDFEVDIINYDPGREFPKYDVYEIEKKYLQKLQKFNEFNEKQNGVKLPVYRDMNDESINEYDYYITGSDQVWNTSFVFAKEAYFLNFVKKGKKISYAASIGIPVTSYKLKKEWFTNNLPSFDAISVREASYVEFLKECSGKNVEAVVDPTFLLKKEDYDELCKDVPCVEGKYMVLYFLKHDGSFPLLLEFSNMISRKFGLNIYYSFVDVPQKVFKNKSETFFYSDPKEFVMLIKNAKCVVTNSFHGTVFSLLYHVPFFTYLVGSMASRVIDLLSEMELENRIVRGYKPLSEDMLEIDFSKADCVIEEKRRNSINFLKSALGVKD